MTIGYRSFDNPQGILVQQLKPHQIHLLNTINCINNLLNIYYLIILLNWQSPYPKAEKEVPEAALHIQQMKPRKALNASRLSIGSIHLDINYSMLNEMKWYK